MSIKKGIGNDALAFLDGQLLEPIPINYQFAYLYLTQGSKIIVDEVNEFITGRTRILQKDVAEMLQRHKGAESEKDKESEDAKTAGITAALQQRDQAINTFVSVAVDLMKETQHTAVNLAASLKSENSHICPEMGTDELQGIIGRIIDKSREAETQLVEAGAKIERLQMDLYEARNTALIDELTGLPNRRAARQMMERLDGDQLRYTVAIIDIDHFKRVNDTFGHPVGDRVITHVGKTLTESMAPDLVARWGGEEYVIISSKSLSAAGLQKRLRQACAEIRSRELKVRETDNKLGVITVSGGVVVSDAAHQEALSLADSLLYEAKQAGRDRIYTERNIAK